MSWTNTTKNTATFTNLASGYTDYSSLVTYAVGAKVRYLSGQYKCKLEALDKVPTNATYWDLVNTNQTKS